MSEGTQEVKYATVDEMRQMLEMLSLIQKQLDSLHKIIDLVDTGLQRQINLLVGSKIATAKGSITTEGVSRRGVIIDKLDAYEERIDASRQKKSPVEVAKEAVKEASENLRALHENAGMINKEKE